MDQSDLWEFGHQEWLRAWLGLPPSHKVTAGRWPARTRVGDFLNSDQALMVLTLRARKIIRKGADQFLGDTLGELKAVSWDDWHMIHGCGVTTLHELKRFFRERVED